MSFENLPSAKKQKIETCESINKCIYNELNALPIVQAVLKSQKTCIQSNTTRTKAVCSTRAYEDAYLRECGVNERPCCNQQQCEGLQLLVPDEMKCVLRQFDIPGKSNNYKNVGQMCLLCLRKHVMQSMLQATTENINLKCEHTPIYNLMDVPGEYCLKDTILCDVMQLGCVYLPLVAHRRSAYTTERINGILHVRQLYDKPDFCNRGDQD